MIFPYCWSGNQNVARLGVDYLTLHAAGGVRMMTAAKEATWLRPWAQAGNYAVTSFTESELQATQQIAVSLNDSVIHLAQLAQQRFSWRYFLSL